MKPKYALALLCLLCFAFFTLVVSGCAPFSVLEKPAAYEFSEMRHQRDEHLPRIFDVYQTETELAVYQIETAGVTEQDAAGMVAAIEANLSRLSEFMAYTPRVKPSLIIVSDNVPGGKLESPELRGTTAIFSKSMSVDGSYLGTAARAFLNDRAPWIVYGACGRLFGAPERQTVASYLETCDDMGIMSLSGVRFYACVCGTEAVARATDISALLLQYIDDEYGADALQKVLEGTSELNMDEVKLAWLASLGVDRTYEPQYGDFFEHVSFSSAEGYEVIATSERATYSIKWVPDKAAYLVDADTLETFLYKCTNGIDMLETLLLENAEHPEKLWNIGEHLTFYVDESGYGVGGSLGFSNWDTREIELYRVAPRSQYIHELTHMFTPSDRLWLAEGLADYINDVPFGDYVSRVKYADGSGSCDVRLAAMRACYDGTYPWSEGVDEATVLANGTWLPEYYLLHGGSFSSDAELDDGLYLDAQAYMQYKMLAYLGTPELFFSDENATRSSGGYGAFSSFVNYLVNNYSLRQVLSLCTDYASLEQTFGKDFQTLYNEWYAWLFRDAAA
jgi:hypothetical protein